MSKKITPEDEQLWRAATKDVSTKRNPTPPRPDRAEFVAAMETSAPLKSKPAAQEKSPRRTAKPVPLTPLDARQAKQRFKAHPLPEASLDLHGMTQDHAHAALAQFLTRQWQRGARCVEIITGKGRSSEGVLRRMVPLWLEEPRWRAHISAIAHAPENKGGAGALRVLLKSRPKP